MAITSLKPRMIFLYKCKIKPQNKAWKLSNLSIALPVVLYLDFVRINLVFEPLILLHVPGDQTLGQPLLG